MRTTTVVFLLALLSYVDFQEPPWASLDLRGSPGTSLDIRGSVSRDTFPVLADHRRKHLVGAEHDTCHPNRKWRYFYVDGLFANATHYVLKSNDTDAFDMESLTRMGYLYAHGDTRTYKRLRANIQQGKPIVPIHLISRGYNFKTAQAHLGGGRARRGLRARRSRRGGWGRAAGCPAARAGQWPCSAA